MKGCDIENYILCLLMWGISFSNLVIAETKSMSFQRHKSAIRYMCFLTDGGACIYTFHSFQFNSYWYMREREREREREILKRLRHMTTLCEQVEQQQRE